MSNPNNDLLKNDSLESTTNQIYNKLDTINSEETLLNEPKHHNPPFFPIVDYLFAKVTKGKYTKAITNLTAEELSAKIENAGESAARWGGVSTVVLTEGVYTGAEKLLPNFYGNVSIEWQTLGLAILTGGMIYYSDDFQQWEKEHPVYMKGMKAATAAYGLITALDMLLRHL